MRWGDVWRHVQRDSALRAVIERLQGSVRRLLVVVIHSFNEIDALKRLTRSWPLGGQMPVTTFNSFTDGLDPNRRSPEHFTANTNLDDDRLWVPYAEGVWVQ